MRYSYRIIHENEGYSNESNESINTKHPIEKDLSDYLLINERYYTGLYSFYSSYILALI